MSDTCEHGGHVLHCLVCEVIAERDAALAEVAQPKAELDAIKARRCGTCRYADEGGAEVYCQSPRGPARGAFVVQPWFCADWKKKGGE